MANVSKETLFVSILLDRDLFVKAHTSPVFDKSMLTGKNLEAYEYIKNYNDRYGAPPSRELVESDVGIRLVDPAESPADVNYLIDYLINRRINQECRSYVSEVLEILNSEDSYESFVSATETFLNVINTKYKSDISVTNIDSIKDALIERHNRRAKLPDGIDGIRSGWDLLDKATLGFQKRTATYVTAKSKVGKTFFILLLANAALAQGKKVLLISPEMSDMQLLGRLACIKTGVSYRKLREGRCTKHEVQLIETMLGRIATDKNISVLCASEHVSITNVEAMVAKELPDIVFIDSFYLLHHPACSSSRSEYENVAKLVTEIGRMKRVYNVPFVCSTQLNRKAERKDKASHTTDTIAHSAQIENDADDIFHLYSDSELKQQKVMLFRTLASRDHSGVHFLLNWDFDSMLFTEIGECNENGELRDDGATVATSSVADALKDNDSGSF